MAAGAGASNPIADPHRSSARESETVIVRGAVLSENRLVLEPAKGSHRVPAPASLDSVGHAEPQVVERIVPAPITLEAVIDWMKQGDAREQLTAHLADDLSELRAVAR